MTTLNCPGAQLAPSTSPTATSPRGERSGVQVVDSPAIRYGGCGPRTDNNHFAAAERAGPPRYRRRRAAGRLGPAAGRGGELNPVAVAKHSTRRTAGRQRVGASPQLATGRSAPLRHPPSPIGAQADLNTHQRRRTPAARRVRPAGHGRGAPRSLALAGTAVRADALRAQYDRSKNSSTESKSYSWPPSWTTYTRRSGAPTRSYASNTMRLMSPCMTSYWYSPSSSDPYEV